MANLLSELERFEEEMKQLGAAAALPLPPPPPHMARGVLPPPAPPGSRPYGGSHAQYNAQAHGGRGQPFGAPPPPPPRASPPQTTATTPLAAGLAMPGSSRTPPPPPFLAPTSAPSPRQPSPVSSWAGQVAFPPTPPAWRGAQLSTPPPGGPHYQPPAPLSSRPPAQYQAYNPATGAPVPWGAAPPHALHSDPADIQALLSAQAAGHTSVAHGAIVSAPPAVNTEAQELFERDAAATNPEALATVKAALAAADPRSHGSGSGAAGLGGAAGDAAGKKRPVPRKAAGETWVDPTLAEWPEGDHRLFCGDLGNEVNDDVLTRAFAKYATFNMARVVRDKRTGKTKGYGFVSFSSPSDAAAALKEMNGKYVGNRPVKLRKSTWEERVDEEALKQRHKKKPKKSKHVLHM